MNHNGNETRYEEVQLTTLFTWMLLVIFAVSLIYFLVNLTENKRAVSEHSLGEFLTLVDRTDEPVKSELIRQLSIYYKDNVISIKEFADLHRLILNNRAAQKQSNEKQIACLIEKGSLC